MNPLTRSPARPSITSVRPGRPRFPHRETDGASALVTWVLPAGVAAATPPQEDEGLTEWLRSLRHQGISVVLSLDIAVSLDSTSLQRAHMHAIRCPLRPDAVPVERMTALCAGVLRLLRQGDRVAVHCDTRLERTALFAGALLIWTGRPLGEAIEIAQHLSGDDVSAVTQRFLRDFQGAVAGVELTGAFGTRRLVG